MSLWLTTNTNINIITTTKLIAEMELNMINTTHRAKDKVLCSNINQYQKTCMTWLWMLLLYGHKGETGKENVEGKARKVENIILESTCQSVPSVP
jgi:hypothetical protein